jgi:hypothetical protein
LPTDEREFIKNPEEYTFKPNIPKQSTAPASINGSAERSSKFKNRIVTKP